MNLSRTLTVAVLAGLAACQAPQRFAEYGWPMQYQQPSSGQDWSYGTAAARAEQAAPSTADGRMPTAGRERPQPHQRGLDLPGEGQPPSQGLAQTAQAGEGVELSSRDPYAAPEMPLPGTPSYAEGQHPSDQHGWGNGVVPAHQPGIRQGTAARGMEPEIGGGRTHIIELYSEAIDERDALRDEVEGLNRALEASAQELELERQQAEALRQRLADVERENVTLFAENEELLARLVTAQIRRLESDKTYLESRLEWERAERDRKNPRSAARATPGKDN